MIIRLTLGDTHSPDIIIGENSVFISTELIDRQRYNRSNLSNIPELEIIEYISNKDPGEPPQ